MSSLPPYPFGWYALGFSDEIARGSVVTRKLGGRDVVLFRTDAGAIVAMDPICPHNGAHMGHGGTVVGDTLRCPFHGFRFDGSGTCVATGYGTKPPKARATTHAVCERHGVVFVWLDPRGTEPTWTIPELDMSEFSKLKGHRWALRGHPQDTTENSVDIGHLTVVHGYERADQIGELKTEGPYLNVRYSMTRPLSVLKRKVGRVHAEFEIHVHGLGYSFVEVIIPMLGIQTRHFVFATPIDDHRLELRAGLAVRRFDVTPGIHPVLATPIRRLIEPLFLEQAFTSYLHDIQQDFDIWNNKVHVEQPALALGDGPIARYRKWATQFYEPASVAAPKERSATV